jgi:hypothetical protein
MISYKNHAMMSSTYVIFAYLIFTAMAANQTTANHH